MDKTQLEIRVAEMKKSLFDQRYLDEYQFTEMERIASRGASNAEKVMTAFFQSVVPNFVQLIEESLRRQPPHDFQEMINNVDEIVRNSTAVGAPTVTPKCFTFMDYCEKQDAIGCHAALLEIKEELAALKQKLDPYFQLERQLRDA